MDKPKEIDCCLSLTGLRRIHDANAAFVLPRLPITVPWRFGPEAAAMMGGTVWVTSRRAAFNTGAAAQLGFDVFAE
jgi:hypothetical protein